MDPLPLEIDSFLIEPLLMFPQLLFAGFQLAAAVDDFKIELLPLLFDLAIPQFGGSFPVLFRGLFFVLLLQLPKRLAMRKRSTLAIEFLPPGLLEDFADPRNRATFAPTVKDTRPYAFVFSGF